MAEYFPIDVSSIGSYSGSFSGSFFGNGSGLTGLTASYFSGSISNAISASYAATASYAANGGVTQITAGGGITLSPTNGLGNVTINSTAATYNTATGSYGSFYDTGSYTATSATAIYSMSLSTTDISNGVFVSGSDRTRIYVTNAGVYNLQFSAQFRNTHNNENEGVAVWLRKNDGSSANDVVDSNSFITVPGAKVGDPGETIAAWNFFLQLAAGDFVQLLWHAESSNYITLETIAAGTNPVHPLTPSLIATVQRVDTFLSNTGSFSGSFNGSHTGSFSGSFTGSLLGTASWATNALTASYLNTLNQNLTFNGNLTLNGTASISTLVVNQTQYSSGSNQLGDAANDTQTLYGTVRIPTGSLTVSGSIIASGSDATINGVRVGRGGGNQLTNTAVGDTTLNNNTTGTANTAVGYLALGSGNTTGTSNSAFGYLALRFSTGGSNCAFGTTALYGMTAGSSNSAFGRDAGYYIADGTTALTSQNSSVFLGANTKALTQGSTNEIVIGQNAIGLGSNSAVLGNDSITRTALKGNVSIGTTGSISSTLHVKGAGATSGTTALRVENTNASASLVVLDNGSVGIGTASPSVPLEVVGNTIISGSITQRGGGIYLYDINGYGGGRIYGSWGYTNGEIYIQPASAITQAFVFSPNNGMSIGGFTIGGTTGVPPAYGLAVSGSIGIGTRTPITQLDVSGSGRFTSNLTVTGSLIATSFTGSLQGTASWATNVVTASAAGTNTMVQYNNNGVLGGTSKFTFDGTTLFAGVTLKVSNGALITGSLIVSGANGGIDTSTSLLLDQNYAPTVDWNSMTLNNPNNADSVDWGNRWLYSSAGSTTVDWNSALLYDSGVNTSIDWENRQLLTPSGYNALVYNTDIVTNSDVYSKQTISTGIQEDSVSSTTYSGQVIEGTLSGVSTHQLVYLDTDGAWKPTKATVANGAAKMLGICVDSGKSLILIEGDVPTSDDNTNGAYVVGADHGLPVYVSSTTGEMTVTAPSGTGELVRIVGHIYYQSTTDTNWWTMKFRPSNDWYVL